MYEWINEHRPSLIIGVGLGSSKEFAKAVFGDLVNFQECPFKAGDKQMAKRVLIHTNGWKKLIVVPHFSGANGLNSFDAIEKAGEYARGLLHGKFDE